MEPTPPRVHPQQALAVYAEPLAVGCRVAVFGDASTGIGARFAELGARSVHVWDPDADRARREAARAGRVVPVHPLSDDEPEPRGSAFDLAVVSDISLFDDPEALLARVRRLVGDEGAALVAAPGRGLERDATRSPFDYYALFDLVAREFRDVAMVGLVSFRGVALAELGDTESLPAVSVDTRLAGANRAPEGFLALASERGLRLDPYAVVELPGAAVGGAAPSRAAEDHTVDRALAARADAERRVETLRAQVQDLGARAADAERQAQAARRLQTSLDECASRAAALEQALAERTRELAVLAGEVVSLREQADEHQALAERVHELAARAERAEAALADAEPEVERIAEAHARELARYEETLRERARAIGHLEAEITRRERLVRELVDRLEESAQAGGAHPPDAATAGRVGSDVLAEENAQLRRKLDALALDVARREGDAQATAWTVAELERRLQLTGEAGRGEGDHSSNGETHDAQLAAVLDELDVLRRALAQEHEARVRAESEGELARARAEIERQAAEIDELRRGVRPAGE